MEVIDILIWSGLGAGGIVLMLVFDGLYFKLSYTWSITEVVKF